MKRLPLLVDTQVGGMELQIGQDMQRSTYLHTMWQRHTDSAFWKTACGGESNCQRKGVKPQVEAKIDVQIALKKPACFG